jgi:putative DNA primase/helicase
MPVHPDGPAPESPTELRPGNVPDALRSRDQWLCWDRRADKPKQPHWDGDHTISWSDPSDWHSFAESLGRTRNKNEWGLGYVVAVGNTDHPTGVISVIDIDGARDPETGELDDWVPDLQPFDEHYAELSPSGTGIHIPVVGTDLPDWWRDTHIDEHTGVDVLQNSFCTVTGWQLDGFGDDIAQWDDDVRDWLAAAYEALTGEQPARPDDGQQSLDDLGSGDSGEYDGEWLTEDAARDALDHVDPDLEHDRWRDIGFALEDHFPTSTAKRLFTRWSRGGSKFGGDAKREIESIVSGGGSGVTIATLIDAAKQGGWDVGEHTPDPKANRVRTPKELVAEHSDEYDSPEDVPDDLFTGAGETATDGGADGDSGGETQADDTAGDDAPPDWGSIYAGYQGADDADAMLGPRYDASRRLLHDEHFRTLIENDALFWYDPALGIYLGEGEERLRETLDRNLREQFKTNESREIAAKVRARTTVRQSTMGGPDQHICVANGVLEVSPDGITMHDHNPQFNFLARASTEYDPDAEAPRWQQFLDESLSSQTDRRKLQEFAGYMLMHWTLPYHRALFLVGPTASGKSTFLDTLRTLLGDDKGDQCVASLTPQEMTSERFSGAELHGAWANIRNDIPDELIENVGQFKEIIGGDPIKAEEKYKDPFKFEPTAKHAFSANKLPEASVDDRAFYRRILLVAFPTETPVEDRDPALDEKLQAEHAGVLNWAIEGLQRLMTQGGFTGDRDPAITEDTWRKWSNTVKRFADKCLHETGDGEIPSSDVWEAYLDYCEVEGIPTRDRKQEVTKELKKLGFNTGRAYINGSQQRVVAGAEFSPRGEKHSTGDFEPEDGDQSGLYNF